MSDCDVTQMGELMASERQPEDIEEAELSTSPNTTNGKIKPCSNKKCNNHDVTDSDQLNCSGYFPHTIMYCNDYRA